MLEQQQAGSAERASSPRSSPPAAGKNGLDKAAAAFNGLKLVTTDYTSPRTAPSPASPTAYLAPRRRLSPHLQKAAPSGQRLYRRRLRHLSGPRRRRRPPTRSTSPSTSPTSSTTTGAQKAPRTAPAAGRQTRRPAPIILNDLKKALPNSQVPVSESSDLVTLRTGQVPDLKPSIPATGKLTCLQPGPPSAESLAPSIPARSEQRRPLLVTRQATAHSRRDCAALLTRPANSCSTISAARCSTSSSRHPRSEVPGRRRHSPSARKRSSSPCRPSRQLNLLPQPLCLSVSMHGGQAFVIWVGMPSH